MLNLRQRQFFESHDVACPHCSYNLRGIKKARCSECGKKLRLGTADQLQADLDSYLKVEDIEYGMYKQISFVLSAAIGIIALVVLVTQNQIQWPSRIAISVGIAVIAGLNLLIRSRLYASENSRLPFYNRHQDRIRDGYGALSMILLIFALGLIGFLCIGGL